MVLIYYTFSIFFRRALLFILALYALVVLSFSIYHLIKGDFSINEQFEILSGSFYILLFIVIYFIKKRGILDKEDNLLLVKNKFFFVKPDVFNIKDILRVEFNGGSSAKLTTKDKSSKFIIRDKQNFIDQILSVNPNVTIVK